MTDRNESHAKIGAIRRRIARDHTALAEISAIRRQIARDTEFRGYGPASVAASGVLALLVAALQTLFHRPEHDIGFCLSIWMATAVVAAIVTGIETITRARRVHSGLAKEMIHSAVEQFLPAISGGALLAVVLFRFAPQDRWMLPGLWEIIFSLGVFASCRFLPRQMFIAGVWYLAAGLIGLALASADRGFSPWAMGLPFGVGQLLVAAVLQFGYRDLDARA